MRIYYAALEGFEPSRAIARGRRGTALSALAWSLLLWALRREGLETLPETGLDARGRPCFPGREDIRFSLSHTEGWALCALGRAPLGADVQLISPRGEAFAARLMSGREREDFTLHELWCLRESVYKLAGEGDLRAMRFCRRGGVIVPPLEGVACRLYGEVPGCAAAAAAMGPERLPDALERAETRELMTNI